MAVSKDQKFADNSLLESKHLSILSTTVIQRYMCEASQRLADSMDALEKFNFGLFCLKEFKTEVLSEHLNPSKILRKEIQRTRHEIIICDRPLRSKLTVLVEGNIPFIQDVPQPM